MHRKNQVKQIININREFNYNDVRLLVHEFIHYTNGKHISPNRHYFTEFLSIYFEFYTIDYLLKKGINKIQKALQKQASNGHRATLDKQMSANKSQREDGVYAAEQEMRAAAVWSSGCAQGLPG